ncbi:class I SAM-dependent methyltransferase [Saccharopolyspora karakumensis]|uniref:Class I SAM-dependent methyltransferase n=1 Tax=Saccharopolyspora karakumensis TaxID=2530386 RepID=A0A4R5C231_9PSEU|nr:class I SAM-dependent methyltransferase [Saccharopolyspora karakumensis]TDD90874.1 class I SAM-dependent methyltransferase [Saccharopolyspora karakumensis]
MTAPIYVFTNGGPHGAEQHRCIAASYDPITTGRLAATGVTDGWHCLDVGTGHGSIARWLAEQVAPSGSVLATDIHPADVEAHPNLTVAVHDITTDPLPAERFDLIVVRMLLQHLPERNAVLRELVAALKPGGWLQVDDLDTGYEPVLLATDAAVYEKFLAAKTGHMRSRGGDPEWGRKAPLAMRAAGLVDVDPRPHIGSRHAGSPELALQYNHTFHLRDGLLAAGMTEAELVRVREVMRDPGFRASSSVLHSVQGRKPS